jgi:hypothetical protein
VKKSIGSGLWDRRADIAGKPGSRKPHCPAPDHGPVLAYSAIIGGRTQSLRGKSWSMARHVIAGFVGHHRARIYNAPRGADFFAGDDVKEFSSDVSTRRCHASPILFRQHREKRTRWRMS